jgi:hypothetical protein
MYAGPVIPHLTVQGLSTRIARLEQLTRGMRKDMTTVEKSQSPFKEAEKQAYLVAMAQTCEAMEKARRILIDVRYRIDR